MLLTLVGRLVSVMIDICKKKKQTKGCGEGKEEKGRTGGEEEGRGNGERRGREVGGGEGEGRKGKGKEILMFRRTF